MDFPLHTDALLYVVAAKSILAVLLIMAGIAALFVGARLYRHALHLTPESAEHPSEAEYAYKRLSKDTLLPRGTYVRSKPEDERFTRLDQDRWVTSGTLIRIELTDAATKRQLKMTGLLLMASSLLWGWLAYLSSPLDIPRINKALEVSQEHKVAALLKDIQADTNGLQTQVGTVTEKLDNLHSDTQKTAQAEQVTALLQHTQNASTQLNAQLQKLQTGLGELQTYVADTQKIDALQAVLQDSATQLQQLDKDLQGVHTEVQTVKSLAADTQAVDAVQAQLQQVQSHWQSGVGRLRDALGQAQTQVQNQIQLSTAQLKSEFDSRFNQFGQQQTEQNQAQLQQFRAQLQALQQQISPPTAPSQTAPTAQLPPTATLPRASWQADLTPLQQQLQTVQTHLQTMQKALADLPKNTASAEAVAQLQKDMQQFAAGLATASASSVNSTDNVAVGLAQIQQQITALSEQLQTVATAPDTATAANTASDRPSASDASRRDTANLQTDIALIRQAVQKLPNHFSILQADLQTDLQALREELAKLKTRAAMPNNTSRHFTTSSEAPENQAATVAAAAATTSSDVAATLETSETTAQHAAPAVEQTEAAAPSHPLVKQLLDPSTPKLENWGAYVDIPVIFASGSAQQLRDEQPLKSLGEALQSPHLQHKQILIQGYTDSQGPTAANVRLSEKRANFVRQWLLQNYPLPADKLQTEGKGEADPIASNATAAGRASNRRVRISIK